MLRAASHAGRALVDLALARHADEALMASLAASGTWSAFAGGGGGAAIFSSPAPTFFGAKGGP
jgi:hypothetical protein